MYEQNAAVLITQQENDLLTISTFRLSLPSEKITSTISTFAMTFPTNSITTPKTKLLISKSLVKQLADLNEVDMRESVATTKKSNINVIEKRDVSDPVYISKWFLSVISNKDTRVSSDSEFPLICKKLKDSVRFKEGVVQRRSGYYSCIKTTLHLLLVKEYGCHTGVFIYKTILIRFMVELIKAIDLPSTPSITLLEYLSKIARRVFKLDKMLNNNNNNIETFTSMDTFPQWTQDLYNETLQETATISHSHHDGIKKSLAKFIEDNKRLSKFDLSDIKLWLKQSLRHNNLKDLIQDGSAIGRMKTVSLLQTPIQIPGIRHRDPRELFEYTQLQQMHVNKALTMYDFEKNVSSWHTMLSSADGTYIWEAFLKYYKVGKEFYKHDSVGYSRFILTLLKIIRLWDEIVCERYPLLLEHRSGIDLKIIKQLLVTNRNDLISVSKIETYFLHRDKKAKRPSLIEETSPTPDSFAHHYVESSNGTNFKQVRSHILQWGKGQVDKKLIEVHKAREACERVEGINTIEYK